MVEYITMKWVVKRYLQGIYFDQNSRKALRRKKPQSIAI